MLPQTYFISVNREINNKLISCCIFTRVLEKDRSLRLLTLTLLTVHVLFVI